MSTACLTPQVKQALLPPSSSDREAGQGGGGEDGLREPEPGKAVERGSEDRSDFSRGVGEVGWPGLPPGTLETSFGGPSQTSSLDNAILQGKLMYLPCTSNYWSGMYLFF